MFLDKQLLESVNADNEETLEEGYVCEGCGNYLQLCLESEISWGNLLQETYQSEFIAIKNEDVELFEESVKETSAKILAWIKEKLAQVAAFFRKIINNFKLKVTNLDRYVKKNESVIRSAMNANANPEVSIREWNMPVKLDKLVADCDGACKMVIGAPKEKLDQFATDKKFTDFASSYIKDPAIKERKVSNINQYFDVLKEFKSVVNRISTLEKTNISVLKNFESAVKGDKGEEVKKYKKACSLIDKISTTCISLTIQLTSDSLKVVSGAIKVYKGHTKDLKGKETGVRVV